VPPRSEPLIEDVVFVGGASVTLWITDPGAPAPRPTKDVDVVIEVATLADFHYFEGRLRARGFWEDRESGVICRWRHPSEAQGEPLILDAMPAEARMLGFTNKWQAAAIPRAARRELPSGRVIRVITPPYLVATKLEAFKGRGNGDHLGSRDLEDIVTLVDGREELVSEVANSPPELRRYLWEEIQALLDEPRFTDALFGFGFLRGDMASQARAEAVVLPRLQEIAAQSVSSS
jgi:hypothetical protein